jgi:hypothetical protein
VDILAISTGKHLGYIRRGGQTTHKSDDKNKASKTFIGKYNIDSGKLLDLSKGKSIHIEKLGIKIELSDLITSSSGISFSKKMN